MRPYSLAVLPDIDRVVSTSTDMLADYGAHLQIWRLSDLSLLHTSSTTSDSDGTRTRPAKSKGEDHLFPANRVRWRTAALRCSPPSPAASTA
jgi:hypothetical protein